MIRRHALQGVEESVQRAGNCLSWHSVPESAEPVGCVLYQDVCGVVSHHGQPGIDQSFWAVLERLPVDRDDGGGVVKALILHPEQKVVLVQRVFHSVSGVGEICHTNTIQVDEALMIGDV